MAKLYAVKDSNGNVKTVGYYKKLQLDISYPNDTIVELTNATIPKDYKKGHYEIDTVDGEDSLKRKAKVDRDAVDQAAVDAQKVPNLDALIALNPNTESGSLKTVIEFLQAVYG